MSEEEQCEGCGETDCDNVCAMEALTLENEVLKAQLAKANASGAVLVEIATDMAIEDCGECPDGGPHGMCEADEETCPLLLGYKAIKNLSQATKDYMAVHEAMKRRIKLLTEELRDSAICDTCKHHTRHNCGLDNHWAMGHEPCSKEGGGYELRDLET